MSTKPPAVGDVVVAFPHGRGRWIVAGIVRNDDLFTFDDPPPDAPSLDVVALVPHATRTHTNDCECVPCTRPRYVPLAFFWNCFSRPSEMVAR